MKLEALINYKCSFRSFHNNKIPGTELQGELFKNLFCLQTL